MKPCAPWSTTGHATTVSKRWCVPKPQIIADVTGLPVVATQGGEAAYGDAMLAAVGVGIKAHDQLHTWLNSQERERRVDPDPQARTVHDQRYPHFLGLYQPEATFAPGVSSQRPVGTVRVG